jgi:feruloyl esterase
MMGNMFSHAVFAMLFCSVISATAAAQVSCDSIGRGTILGNSNVLSSQSISSGTFTAPGGKKLEALPPFCRIVARATPSPESNIIIEVWLPEASTWNGKLLGTGNGGFAGTIAYSALAGGIQRGYAVANTDMGTFPASLPGVGYQAGNGRPEVVKDWGHRATHEMTLLARAVTDEYYGKKPAHTYFAGCSTGGHQALTEAQRYPDDYDAILAGAPGHNRTHLHAMFTSMVMATSAPGALLTPENLALWSQSLKNACVGKDGGAPGDNFLTDPTQCSFSPRQMLCKAGQSPTQCLQEPQVKALEIIYGGTRNPRTGALIYPPQVRGVEGTISTMLSDETKRKSEPPTELSRWVFGPKWDGATFDFDRDMAKEDQALGKEVNALDTDLSRFAAHGGKLILYHGWADSIISPIDSILYYDRITANGEEKSSFVRLFMAPGMNHCGGGEGPNIFGQSPDYKEGDTNDDLLVALDHWVTSGVAPDTVMATKYQGESPFGSPPPPNALALAARPLCAYPKIARYKGTGDATKAENFACSDASPAKYEMPAPEYLK